MSSSRTSPPRRQGLLQAIRSSASRERGRYPYAIDDRIDGDLTVIGHLAKGRWGHIYQVWSASEWCPLTCKIVAPDHADDRRALAALRRESRILSRLAHPNIVQQYGAGDHDGLPYVVMEYLEGPSLLDVLEDSEDRRLSVADAVRAAVHVGAGLYHLHRRGFLYLDLKPANLLIKDQVPVLIDFDTARPRSMKRRPRDPTGTAPYMAPEQVWRDPPTPACDVYGLSAVLYELLTGRWPFESVYTGEEQRSGEERDYPQLGQAPPPSPREFNGDVPASLEETVLRALERDPADRFPSLHPLLLALVAELGERGLWPHGVRPERRSEPREG